MQTKKTNPLKSKRVLWLCCVCALGVWLYLNTSIFFAEKSQQQQSIVDDSRSSLKSRSCYTFHDKRYGIECYEFTPKDTAFTLPIVLFRYKHHQLSTEESLLSQPLVVHIAGGPGQGGATRDEEIEYWLEWLKSINANFDFLVYDPRGTGEQAWNCEPFAQATRNALGKSLSVEKELSVLNAALQPCFTAYEAHITQLQPEYNDHSLLAFSSHYQASDVVNIGRALNYNNMHLWGVSYGTRVALLAASQPEVKTLLLDSPYPFRHGKFSELVQLYLDSFALHQELFAQFSSGTSGYRSFDDVYLKAYQRLSHMPIETEVATWVGDEKIRFVLTPHRLLEMSFSVLYSRELYYPFYTSLENFALTGKVSEDLHLVLESYVAQALDNRFNPMVFFTTECIDNIAETPGEIDSLLAGLRKELPAEHQHLHAVITYFSRLSHGDACQLYDFSDTLKVNALDYNDKPTLIFSGRFDPITPAKWGEDLAKQLPRGRFVNKAQAGHGVLFDVSCDWSFYKEMIKNTTMDKAQLHQLTIACEE